MEKIREFNFKKGLLILILPLVFFFSYNLLYRDRVLLNVYFAGDKVAGLSREDLQKLIEEKVSTFEQDPIVLTIVGGNGQAGSRIETRPQDLGITLDSEQTLLAAYSLGRSGNLARDQLSRFKSLFVKRDIEPVYEINFALLSPALDGLLADRINNARDATIVLGEEFKIENEQTGQSYDRGQFAQDLRVRLQTLSTAPIAITLVTVEPRVKAVNAHAALQKAKSLNDKRIALTFGRDRWTLAGENLLETLKLAPSGLEEGYLLELSFGDGEARFTDLKLVDWQERELNVSLDKTKIGEFVDEIAQTIDRETVDATLVFDGQKVSSFKPARDGQKLDRKLTEELLAEKAFAETTPDSGEIIISLPVTVSGARIANEGINELGIKELIGRGVSYFRGSIVNRVHNLTLGSQRISGTLIKPQEVFSFNKTVGEVSGATGYKQAYVISQGRTVLDDGGGICQVSTTVFRAALAAGLPIVARTAHAYRVGYYEQSGFKAGLDATVWAPAVDFAFKNDTNHHILVQAVVDPVTAKLQVDIYGTSDGRKVELSEPIVGNLKPAPPDKYQEDPTLARGITKQVDFAAVGATSVFKRAVYKDNQLIIDETFKSNFRPWQAVYLVGTGG